MLGQLPDSDCQMQHVLMSCRSSIASLQAQAKSLKDAGNRKLLVNTLSKLNSLHELSIKYLRKYGAALEGNSGKMALLAVPESFSGALQDWLARNHHTPISDGMCLQHRKHQ
jgi:hypothetical protein